MCLSLTVQNKQKFSNRQDLPGIQEILEFPIMKQTQNFTTNKNTKIRQLLYIILQQEIRP